ncbi:hypothetical protein SERLA73DRAFT_174019 [Serpula lacrymans var. lacrymans S7.3]|uniref:DRBM domain-containing protein n=2 Tax=Serpula lacrymans var. lacrymans TaxID=341189 RepID=F8PH45_SERL3|nr:uncharacterized protein SERLADRAFT_455023 [Serpula lacrymans var. lacrymans S7.9]EGO04941.1 hypothetical protein SERLA73DRAFT_174019 [Serpula lacrymans var. lacrymans S7.3]EGO30741.1 hypothetical protein SERLADRAFT_455023 [Serpula lacrymans var. lacrymans S7.9]
MLTPRLRNHVFDSSIMPSTSTPDFDSGKASVDTINVALKRSRSPTQMGDIPELPKLQGESILEVFTHRSLRIACKASYHDSETLAVLGEEVLHMMTTQLLLFKKPRLKVEEITNKRHMLLQDEMIDNWTNLYRLRNQVRCDPSSLSSLNSVQEGRLLFNAYLGAVFAQGGIKPVQEWIGGLFRLSSDLFRDSSTAEPGPSGLSSQPAKKLKVDDEHYSVLPPSSAPPPIPSPPPFTAFLSNPLTPAQPNLAFLPLFNQAAHQRGVTISYPATFSGPAHAGTWAITCVVNGIKKGHGCGPSKQLAKEEAAKEAYFAMGWAPRG